MKYHLGDKFVLEGIECKVSFVDAAGNAYLTPEADGEYYYREKTLVGLVFAVINPKGVDAKGNKVRGVVNKSCGAV